MRTLVIVLTDPLSALMAKGEIKARYYNPEGVFSHVHFISPASEEIPSADAQVLVGEKAQLTVHALGFLRYFGGFLPYGAFAERINEIQPDIIRAYSSGIAGSLAVFWAKRLHVPSVISLHADYDDQRSHERRLRYQLRRLFEFYSLKRASQVVCVTNYLVRYARKYGAKQINVIYNRVHCQQYSYDRPESPGSDSSSHTQTILSVGRLTAQKAQDCLIRAIAGLDLNLILIGSGERHKELKHLVKDLGLNDRVRFVPAVPNSEISAYYKSADIFAIATHYEGFCIPVLEAMAAGLPIVASKIGPIEEILGDTGALVSTSPQAFADALEVLKKDHVLRKTLGERARARALTLDGAKMEQQEKAMYLSLTNGAKKRTETTEPQKQS